MLEKLISGTLTAAILAASTPVYARIPDEYRLNVLKETDASQKYSLIQIGISAPEQNKCPPYLMHLPECQQPAPSYVPSPSPPPNLSPAPSPSSQPAPAPTYSPSPYSPAEPSSSNKNNDVWGYVLAGLGIIGGATTVVIMTSKTPCEEQGTCYESSQSKEGTTPVLIGSLVVNLALIGVGIYLLSD